MIRAYRLTTRRGRQLARRNGTISQKMIIPSDPSTFEETPPHSSSDRHNDSVPQWVVYKPGFDLHFTPDPRSRR